MTRTKITSWYVQGVANADDLSGLVEYLTELGVNTSSSELKKNILT